MKSDEQTSPRAPRRRAPAFGLLLALLVLSSYCTSPGDQTPNDLLTADESYLVDSYVRASRALDLHPVSPLESESLFAVLDSTLDTLRIANTIRELGRDPDRWILVFREIDKGLESASRGTGSEELR